MKAGIPTGSIIQATTAKEKADRAHRRKEIQEIVKKNKRTTNKLYGAFTYQCSSCENTMRSPDPLEGRMIQCKCNNGFFTKLVKDDSKSMAASKEVKPKKYPSRRKGN